LKVFYMNKLTHFDKSGRSKMVDVTDKSDTVREAVAQATVTMQKETLRRIIDRQIEKGDVLGVAQTAGIMAAKKTAELIPMCHPLNITSVEMEFLPHEAASQIEVRAQVKITGKTGVEMEALVAVSVASLTIYDMCKAIDRGITISDIKLLRKSGGKSGRYERPSI
jgi:cyclic pyranopterin phosphate synthase